jgi:hypothetical protein
MGLPELADWWDAQKRESEQILGEWVADNPQWWAIGIATAASTAMELGAGTVDALRFGQGLAKGTAGGAGTDALRMLVLLGPLAKAGGTLGRLAHTRMLRLAVTTDVAGPCSFTAVNNALTIVGGKTRNLFVTAKDAARALGVPLSAVPKAQGVYQIAAWIDELVPFLVKQGVRLRVLGIPKTIADVAAAARANDGVVIFAIKWIDSTGRPMLHSMIAVRTSGGVKFADYGGKFISDLSELAARGGKWVSKNGYQILSDAPYGNAVLIEGMRLVGMLERHARQVASGSMLLLGGVHAVQTPDGIDLALPVAPAAAIETTAHEAEVVKASFSAFKARKSGAPLMKLPPVRLRGPRNGAPAPEFLTGVQYRLNALGFAAGMVDGKNGPRTQRAVRSFQQTYALDVDGIPGPMTQKRLVDVCGF